MFGHDPSCSDVLTWGRLGMTQLKGFKNIDFAGTCKGLSFDEARFGVTITKRQLLWTNVKFIEIQKMSGDGERKLQMVKS